jgi:hypothetical protein
MKKWLKDHSLEPGSGLSHHIVTKSGMMTAFSAFKVSLAEAGVKLEHHDDTSTALLGLLSGLSSQTQNEKKRDSEHVDDDGNYGYSDNSDTASEKSSTFHHLINGTNVIDEVLFDGKRKKSAKNSSVNKKTKNNIEGKVLTGKTDIVDNMVLVDNKTGNSSTLYVSNKLPVHLRPKPIIIGSNNVEFKNINNGVVGMIEGDHDDSASALVEILNQLKQQQQPEHVDIVSDAVKNQCSLSEHVGSGNKNIITQHLDKLSKSRAKQLS